MKQSAGLLIYKIEDGQVKVLLGHIGGPYYLKKDEAAWDIPKGETDGEDALKTAYREFKEETGHEPPTGEPQSLGEFKASGKIVSIWALEGDLAAESIKSNTFKQEWPPKSGKVQEFSEVDRADWFDLPTAMKKIVKSRRVFLERLAEFLNVKITNTSENYSDTDDSGFKQVTLL